MAFRFEKNKWFYTYMERDENGTVKDLWQKLVEAKDPILKKYVIFKWGFDHYADGICGCTHFGALLVRDNYGVQGWNSRPEAYEWMKKNHLRNVSRKAINEYGRGAYAETYRIMRLDKYIKHIAGGKDWYLRETCSEPNYATLV